MNQIDIVLPGGHPAKLLYAAEYQAAIGAAVAWLQQRKLASEWKKKAYEDHLPKYAKMFAEGLAARPECAADVVLVPASASRFFDPYLSKLQELKPELVVVDDLFEKASGFEAGVDGQPYEAVLAGTILARATPPEVAGATRVLIIDDIYNTGNTAGAMITRIRPLLAAQPQVTIACVLYVPLKGKNDEFDWEKTVKEKSYHRGTGRRKTAIARVRLCEGMGKISINCRGLEDYFTEDKDRAAVTGPLDLSEMRQRLDVIATVQGGGFTGQAGAIRQGLARALKEMFGLNEPASADCQGEAAGGMAKKLRNSGYLTRDSRMKERKKYGRKGARKAFQFSKR